MKQIQMTNNCASNGVKMLVHGKSGVGKTRLVATLPRPFVISVENGLLSLRDHQIPYQLVESYEDVMELYNLLLTPDYSCAIDSIVLDSLTDISNTLLSVEKSRCKDVRQAYTGMGDKLLDIVRRFRNIEGKHVYFTAHESRILNAEGKLLFGPALAWDKLAPQLPYYFDEVFSLRFLDESKGRETVLQCNADNFVDAKDRSGALDIFEPPHLGHIIAKIEGTV